jgi:hypothetical protein
LVGWSVSVVWWFGWFGWSVFPGSPLLGGVYSVLSCIRFVRHHIIGFLVRRTVHVLWMIELRMKSTLRFAGDPSSGVASWRGAVAPLLVCHTHTCTAPAAGVSLPKLVASLLYLFFRGLKTSLPVCLLVGPLFGAACDGL